MYLCKLASLEDVSNPDWVSCLKIGHDSQGVSNSQSVARYAHAQARSSEKRQIEDEEEDG